MNIKSTYTFQEIDGLWVAVDSACQTPPNLAEVLNELNIIIDDDCQFCRIIKYNEKYKTSIEYRAYNGSTIRISVHTHEIQ